MEDSTLDLAIMAAINTWLKNEEESGVYIGYKQGNTTASVDGVLAIDKLFELVKEAVASVLDADNIAL